jgi:peptide/nickel transport system substrate-binding protein
MRTPQDNREEFMFNLSRRQLLKTGAAGVMFGSLANMGTARADGDTLTIAFNVNLPSWDPTTGLSAVNPTIQSIYRSVFDHSSSVM